jgi:hypothetical protein
MVWDTVYNRLYKKLIIYRGIYENSVYWCFTSVCYPGWKVYNLSQVIGSPSGTIWLIKQTPTVNILFLQNKCLLYDSQAYRHQMSTYLILTIQIPSVWLIRETPNDNKLGIYKTTAFCMTHHTDTYCEIYCVQQGLILRWGYILEYLVVNQIVIKWVLWFKSR